MITTATDTLEAPPRDLRRRFAAEATTIAGHDRLMDDIASMNMVEAAGSPSQTLPLTFPIDIAAWNLERCLFIEESAAKIADTGAKIVLLSEMDHGMARTGQRHTTAGLARILGMSYAYGVEFIEMGLGSATEREFCTDDVNALGFHGNALLSATPTLKPFLIRLWGERLWRDNDPEQPRLGERCAVGGVIATEAGRFVAVSVHLESATTAAYRERQTAALIDTLESQFPGLPILIGGDLNTGNHAGGDFEAEGLFTMSAARGFFRHGGPLDAMSTRPSLITRWPERAMKLDWFLARGLEISHSALIPSTDGSGRPLSDHDLLTCRIDGFSST
jgi:endonuclease/exonuclease/phosphatase family metal-dependent hydrolase